MEIGSFEIHLSFEFCHLSFKFDLPFEFCHWHSLSFMKQILFVCTGNSCRSVMAEGLFRKWVGPKAKEYAAFSAGISAIGGMAASPETVRVMLEEGVDVSDHHSQHLTADRVRSAHKILVMERMHRDWVLGISPESMDKVHLLTDYASKELKMKTPDIDIPDPIRSSDGFYKDVLNVIKDCVKNFIKTL